jgi:hypothetical protein
MTDLAGMPSLAAFTRTHNNDAVEESIPLPPGADDSRNAISDVGLLIMANPNRIREKPVALSEVSEELVRPLAEQVPQSGEFAEPLLYQTAGDAPDAPRTAEIREIREPSAKDEANKDDGDNFLVPEDGLYGNTAALVTSNKMPAAAGVVSAVGNGADSEPAFFAGGGGSAAGPGSAGMFLPPFPSFANKHGESSSGALRRSRADDDKQRARLRETQGTPMPPRFDDITASQQQQQKRYEKQEKREQQREDNAREQKELDSASNKKEDNGGEQATFGRKRLDGDVGNDSRRNQSAQAEREQSFAEFEAEIQRQAKEQEDTEKREMILLFYEKKNFEKIKVPEKFLSEDAMNCDLHEMRWWYYKLVRDTRIQDAVGGIKQTITQVARGALIVNNTIGNPLNLRLDSNFPTELASVLNNKLDRHLRDYVKSKCGISGPKPNPMRHVAQGIFETVWNYHRNRVALENSEKKAQQGQSAAAAAAQQQQQHNDLFNPARMFGQQPLFGSAGAYGGGGAAHAGPHNVVSPDEYQQFLHWKQMMAARQQQQQQQQWQQQQYHQYQQNLGSHAQQQAHNQQQQRQQQTQMYANQVPQAPQWRAPPIPAQQPKAASLSQPQQNSLAPPMARSFANQQPNQQPFPPQRPPSFGNNRRPLQNAMRFMSAVDRHVAPPPNVSAPAVLHQQTTQQPQNAPSPGLRGDMSLADAARAIQEELKASSAAATNVTVAEKKTLTNPTLPPARPPMPPSLLRSVPAPQPQHTQHSVAQPSAAARQLPVVQRPQRPAGLNRPAAAAASFAPQLPIAQQHLPTLQQAAMPLRPASLNQMSLPIPQQMPQTIQQSTFQRAPDPFVKPLNNTLGQLDVRTARAPAHAKTYDDLMADLEAAAGASRQQYEQGGDDLAASFDDLAHAPTTMPAISSQDKVTDILSLVGDAMNPAPKQEYRPVLDVDDILRGSGSKTSTNQRGAPITSLEEVRRLKQQRAQMQQQQQQQQSTVQMTEKVDEDESLRTIERSTAVLPTRKRRKAAGNNNADAPLRIVREPESPAAPQRLLPASQAEEAPATAHEETINMEPFDRPQTPPLRSGMMTPPLADSAALGSGGKGSAMRSMTRAGVARVTFN